MNVIIGFILDVLDYMKMKSQKNGFATVAKFEQGPGDAKPLFLPY